MNNFVCHLVNVMCTRGRISVTVIKNMIYIAMRHGCVDQLWFANMATLPAYAESVG